MKIMTINVRYINNFDKYSWNERKYVLKEMIENHNPDIIGFQEIMKDHFEFLNSNFNKIYGWYGEYRDQSTSCEMNMIFYKKDKFQVISKNTLWLSETPKEKYTIGWDADLPRVISYVKLKDCDTSDEFYFMNTHFDHVGKEARVNSSHMIIELIKSLDEKTIITGDFNTTPSDGYINTLLNSDILDNSFNYFEDKENSLTIHNFISDIKGEPIDYIFATNNFKINDSKIIRYSKNGIPTSDHYHIIADIDIK